MRYLLLLLPMFLFADGWIFDHDKMTTTTQTMELAEGILTYTTTTGTLDVHDKEGNVQGEIFFTAYTKTGGETDRPVTFVFNGGPGSSSIWLHMGAFGPKRIVNDEEGQTRSPPYRWVNNEETILDLTDLVFIDPIGTGLSKTAEPEDNQFYEVQKDIATIGEFIRDYVTVYNRWRSPKYIAGESYGTTRGAGIAQYLQQECGLYLNGLIFVSVAIDIQAFVFSQGNCLPHALFIPSYAATAWYHKKLGERNNEPLEKVVRQAQTFAMLEYLPSFLLGKAYSNKDELIQKLSYHIGVTPELIDHYYPHFEELEFLQTLKYKEKELIGVMDSRYSDHLSNLQRGNLINDPACSPVIGIFTGAFTAYLQEELNYNKSYSPYITFSEEVNRIWQHVGRSWAHPTLSTLDNLRLAMIVNPEMKVFVGSGYYDLCTPFAATEYVFNHLDLPDSFHKNITMEYYEGGHMYYLVRKAHKKFKNDLVTFYKGK